MTTKSEHIVSFTAAEMAEMVRRGESRTDWERVRNMTPEEIAANIDYEDEGDFREVIAATLAGSTSDDVVAGDVLDWFRRRGPGHEDELNRALRAYIAEQERQAS